MAKIQDWDKIKRTIIVPRYKEDEIDVQLLAHIQELEAQLLKLKRELGCLVDVFIPERHPIVEKNLIRNGKKVEVAEITYCGTFLSEKRNVQLVEHMTSINDLTNIISDEALALIKYDGERYQKATCLVWDEREIFRVPGVTQEELMKSIF